MPFFFTSCWHKKKFTHSARVINSNNAKTITRQMATRIAIDRPWATTETRLPIRRLHSCEDLWSRCSQVRFLIVRFSNQYIYLYRVSNWDMGNCYFYVFFVLFVVHAAVSFKVNDNARTHARECLSWFSRACIERRVRTDIKVFQLFA